MNINEYHKRGKMTDNYLTIKEICGLLKVSRGTVIRWISSGRLKGFKIGRGIRVKSQDFGRFFEARPFKKKRGG
jgi:excisionase family DNA binding protein